MSQPSRRLVFLPISPWSERARWALEHHQLSYERILHAPFLGERRLRRLVGPGPKVATVPVLLVGDERITESIDIARYAERNGQGAKLFPPEKDGEIRRWNQLGDELMRAGRGLVVAALLADPAALDESLPPNLPGFLRPLLRPVTRYAMGWFGRKYGVLGSDRAAQVATMRSVLSTLREALKASSPYLLGRFSYADMIMATSLQGVSPVAERYIRLGPATRRAWTCPELATEFSDLLAWRDRIYELHRRPH